MNKTHEYDSFRAAFARRLANEGKSPAQIRAALADIDAKARQHREAAEKRQKGSAARVQTVSGWVSHGGVVHAVAFKDKTRNGHWFVSTECDRSFVSGRIFKNALLGMVCITCARAVGLLSKRVEAGKEAS